MDMTKRKTKLPDDWFIHMRVRFRANTGKDFAGTNKDMQKIYNDILLIKDTSEEAGDLELEAMKEWRKRS